MADAQLEKEEGGEDDEEAEFAYVCEGCQTEYDSETGEKLEKDKVRRNINTRPTAETLASIHSTLTGHDPEVRRFS